MNENELFKKLDLPKCSIKHCQELKENDFVILCPDHLKDFRKKDT